MPELVIETRGLVRRFGEFTAVDGVDLAVERQQFYGFLGPNGAGKSTTIKMLTGLLRPTAGELFVLGYDMSKDAVEIKSRIGVVPEGLALFERLTGPQLLDFIGRMYGLSRETSLQRTGELLDFMELSSSDGKLVADYSHGMKKKIALAAAIIHRPEVLFLDEPFEGVDAVAATFLKNMLHRFIERGGTVFLTSHVLEVVERLCTHIGIIDKGKIVANDSIGNLRSGVTVQGVHDSPVTLEQIFLTIVGGGKDKSGELQWL